MGIPPRVESPLLTFNQLIEANESRVARWHSIDSWSPLEWAGAMCGEAGEAANYAKKLKRHTQRIQNNDKRMGAESMNRAEIYAQRIGEETADTIVYGSLLCLAVNADLIACLRKVFNEKSEEYGFPERI